MRTPLIGAIIIKENYTKEGSAMVQSSTSRIYVVNSSQRVKGKNMKLRTYVALNQRTFAIIDVLEMSKEELFEASKKITYMKVKF
jgi:ATP-dependent 26S proteasome regulatory subunit